MNACLGQVQGKGIWSFNSTLHFTTHARVKPSAQSSLTMHRLVSLVTPMFLAAFPAHCFPCMSFTRVRISFLVSVFIKALNIWKCNYLSPTVVLLSGKLGRLLLIFCRKFCCVPTRFSSVPPASPRTALSCVIFVARLPDQKCTESVKVASWDLTLPALRCILLAWIDRI